MKQRLSKASAASRRGMAVPEWFMVVGVLAVGLLWWGSSLGSALLSDMGQTATNVGDPSSLVARFGSNNSQAANNSGGGSSGTVNGSDSGGSGGGRKGGPLGNNGVGNGEDPPPPGNAPENDGAGTSPGNPGNKGGAFK